MNGNAQRSLNFLHKATEMINYRPISVISFMANVFERIVYLTIILQNRAEYRLINSLNPCNRKGLVNFISNGTVVTFNTYEATYTAGYLLPKDDRYREHHDHIWPIVLQFVDVRAHCYTGSPHIRFRI